MPIVWRPRALADRESIMDYISRDDPAAAIELDDEFESPLVVLRALRAAQQWP